ncbi:putative Receptor protein kinase CLAVATA1 precursor [Tripterygium wilfordii]|uniref:Putative Receptor protein kinase CLAVATA1 n=1 Tax=Tripterygium wilfordii TaxID=458696 RepID=A0A7J7DNN1_TRIWF|nr:putative Receptor protein kinase CLAVATA1 precursor [Tripterygium wilfordii]
MAKQCSNWYLTVIVFSAILASQASADTDPLDVVALEDLYNALHNPPQLKGWRSAGGDPCVESWTGVSCYGSSVIHLKLPGLGLRGTLGSELQNLHNLKHLDICCNNIQGEIPYGLPPNSTNINLAFNELTQNIPHSLSLLKYLRHLNVSHNLLAGPIGNVFTGLESLKVMDLSYNNFTGDLPSSFGSLTNLTELFLHNNQFTGSIIYLADLPLTHLNIQGNHFSGIIPSQFQSIPYLWIDGNRFHTGANYPPWNFHWDNATMEQNFTGPQTTQSSAIENYPSSQAGGRRKKRMGPGGIACMVVGAVLLTTCAALIIAFRIKRYRALKLQSFESSNSTMHSLPISTARAPEESPQILAVVSPFILGQKPIPPNRHNRIEKMSRRKSFSHNYKFPASAKIYTVAELQAATNSFSEDNLLGEGSLGSVYKAELPVGQILAVKNINMVSLSFHEEEQFFDVICTASRLRHPNIVTLLGYCLEHGQHLLVYQYISDLSLDNILHSQAYKPLSWNLRLCIALGVARALDYLHSSSPPVAHSNIKAANILLDEELMPHLCDCGLAALKPLASNSVKLRASEIALGDTGYIAPDHGQPGSDNTKSDIFAFGVLLLELLTGRKPFDALRPREEQSLVKWASSQLHDGKSLEQMVDPSIKRTLSSRCLSQFADVVSPCIQSEKEFRPQISETVESLTRLLKRVASAKSSVADGIEVDPFERSFRSTHTRFMASPTVSFLSV